MVNTFEGERGSGKSSLVNLILGEELLPYSLVSTPPPICELRYGDQPRIMVHFKDKDPKTGLPVMEVPLEAASAEQSYLGQISRRLLSMRSLVASSSTYKKVEVFWPHQLLKVFNQ